VFGHPLVILHQEFPERRTVVVRFDSDNHDPDSDGQKDKEKDPRERYRTFPWNRTKTGCEMRALYSAPAVRFTRRLSEPLLNTGGEFKHGGSVQFHSLGWSSRKDTSANWTGELLAGDQSKVSVAGPGALQRQACYLFSSHTHSEA
jgi:hypothetical protein